MSNRKLPRYRVTFARIGRNHSVEPLEAKADDADALAEAIHRYARKHLSSRDYDVDLDLDAGKGCIICGMHNGGEFTIAAL